MPPLLSADDFRLDTAICETRYSEAYLVFDRTGSVIQELRSLFTDLEIINPTPVQTTFRSKEGTFTMELAQSRFNGHKPDSSLEKFGHHCKHFFDVISAQLDIKVFTRIGLRVLLRHTFKDVQESRAALNALKLLNLDMKKRFGAAEEIDEILIRWEGEQTGAFLRFKAEKGKIDVVLPPELDLDDPEIHKETNSLLVDVDYYTVAPVEKAQWDPATWMPPSVRIIRNEIDAVMSR